MIEDMCDIVVDCVFESVSEGLLANFERNRKECWSCRCSWLQVVISRDFLELLLEPACCKAYGKACGKNGDSEEERARGHQ
jgi:hypothetical protein